MTRQEAEQLDLFEQVNYNVRGKTFELEVQNNSKGQTCLAIPIADLHSDSLKRFSLKRRRVALGERVGLVNPKGQHVDLSLISIRLGDPRFKTLVFFNHKTGWVYRPKTKLVVGFHRLEFNLQDLLKHFDLKEV